MTRANGKTHAGPRLVIDGETYQRLRAAVKLRRVALREKDADGVAKYTRLITAITVTHVEAAEVRHVLQL